MTPLTPDQARTVEAYRLHVRALASRVLRRWPGHIDRSDVEQFGMLGLIDAVQRFDATRGTHLWGFAEPRVRGAIIDGLRLDAWPRSLRRARRRLEDPTDSGAIPADMLRRIAAVESIAASVQSHDLPDWVYGVSVATDQQEDIHRNQVAALVDHALTHLRPRDRFVVMEYYAGGRTMLDIAHEIGVNESRVSQLLARARRELAPILISLGVHQ
jgi:RNA polymerase sigma factor for flagellar operon FliA